MLTKRLSHSLILLFTAVSISACSNNNSTTKAKPVKTKSVIKHRVEVDSNSKKVAEERKTYATLLDQWNKEDLAKTVEKKKVRKSPHKKVVAQKKNKVYKPSVKNKHLARKRHVVRHQSSNRYKTPSYKAPINNIRYAKLSGDYASNSETHRFIDMMVSKHGFDRGYLNYLFTYTEATPFLQKMAYRDAFGRTKGKKRKKPRAGRWNRYRGNFLTERTISKGIEFWKNNRVALQQAEQKYGVPQEYILGIIGVETRYGGNVGKNRAIDALAAMGFNNPRRGKYFRSELKSYLLMTRKERLDPLKPMASYAGALGLCQFMPSNIKRFAVDHDRNGVVNLWTPSDAIGSVANYFKKHGWKTGGTVAVPTVSSSSRYKTLKTGFKSSHSLNRLRSRGVSTSRIGNISGKASLIKLNTYSGDELWLGGHNFYVITRYNHSTRYAMAVHQLAEAINERIGGRAYLRQASLDSEIQKLN